MNVLFSNPPWWGKQDWIEFNDWETQERRREFRYFQGIRAGSRWPSMYIGQSSPDCFVHKDYITFPYFMAYAASYAQLHTDASVTMRDSIARKESYESYYKHLAENRYDYIFIESSTPSYDVDKMVIAKIQEISPTTKVVLTGSVALRGEELIKELAIHAVIQGEYEKGSVRVINGEAGVIPFDLLTEEEMNAAPFPYMEEEVIYRYYDNRPIGQIHPQAHIWGSRGCPYKCIFCVWPGSMTNNDPDGTKTRKVRYYHKEYMSRYLEHLNHYGFKSLLFDEDTFNLGDKHTKEMCEVLSHANIPWSAMCRADTIKMETWLLMKEAGCFGVSLGFESGSQYVVDKIVNKHLDLEYAKKVVQHLKSIGLSVHGTFTFGLPGETHEQMQETVHYIKSCGFDSYQTSGCAEIEGAPLFNFQEKTSKIVSDDTYDRYADGKKKWQVLSIKLQNS